MTSFLTLFPFPFSLPSPQTRSELLDEKNEAERRRRERKEEIQYPTFPRPRSTPPISSRSSSSSDSPAELSKLINDAFDPVYDSESEPPPSLGSSPSSFSSAFPDQVFSLPPLSLLLSLPSFSSLCLLTTLFPCPLF